MTLRQLQYLVALADTRYFVKAAQKCHTSQPGITLSINNLESELGVKLANRVQGVQNPVTLTAAGEHLVQNARLILDTASLTSNLISKVYDKDGNVNYGGSELVKKTQPGFDNEAASYASL